jgi:quercetin dioxygenase-like cupin family protein
MHARTAVWVVSFALLGSTTAAAQDAVTVAPANYKVLVDNARVRVLKIDYAPGAKSAMHQHPDAIVVSLGPSTVHFTLPDGKTEESNLAADTANYTPATTHGPTNVGSGRVNAILVEFKGAAPGTAKPPTTRDNMAIKVLAEGPYGLAYRVTADPDFQEPAGSTHDYDQVVIALAPAQIALSIGGKPTKTSWARGDVAFIGRGTPHESKNTGGKPVDYVVVAVK